MSSHKQHRILIGIDPGTQSGFAVWDRDERRFLQLETLKIHYVLPLIHILDAHYRGSIYVIFEDARLRKWYGPNAAAKRMGAGSIRRDCAIIEDFLKDFKIPYEKRAPSKGLTKWSEDYFKKVTGYPSRTSVHARDAAMLVYAL